MTAHRNPIIEPCEPARMFARLQQSVVGRIERSALCEVVILPSNVALATSGGGTYWGGLQSDRRDGYALVLPRRPGQNNRRGLGLFDYLVLVEMPQEPTP